MTTEAKDALTDIGSQLRATCSKIEGDLLSNNVENVSCLAAALRDITAAYTDLYRSINDVSDEE